MTPKSREELIAGEAAKHHPVKILDIAYAHGLNRALAETGAELYGLDPLGRPLRGYTRIDTCDINTNPIPFPDETFDMVTMGCVLAHTANPLAVLAKVYAVLKPGGILIVSSPNPHYYWESVLNIFYNRFKKRVSKSKHREHFFEFTRYTMRTSLERAGFSLLKELGSTFHLVKTSLRFNVEQHPAIAFEIVYVAKKTGEPQAFTLIEDDAGATVEFPTKLFS